MAVIVLIKEATGESFGIFFPGKYILGRSSKSDVVIKDSQVSGKHCSLESTESGKIVFTDLGSSNGSFLDQSRITSLVLRIGDIIRIGNTLIGLDEASLTNSERNLIGKTNRPSNNNLTLPSLTKSQQAVNNAHQAAKEQKEEKLNEKNNIVSASEKHKVDMKKNFGGKRAPVEIQTTGKDEVLIEQEESSGHTKFLKLESSLKNKKKK